MGGALSIEVGLSVLTDHHRLPTPAVPSTRKHELVFPMTVRNLTALCMFTVLLGFAPCLIDPATAADVAAGEGIASRWCISCHAVGPAPQKVATEAATFGEIARRSDFNERSLAYFLLDPHPKMPDMSLTRAEAADLAAYIRSLQK